MNLKLSGHECHINNNFFACAMYAVDLIIISASQSGLQAMLDVCVFTCANHSLKFNAKKSWYIYFGLECYQKFDDLMLGNETICWQNFINYLGDCLLSGKCFVQVNVNFLYRVTVSLVILATCVSLFSWSTTDIFTSYFNIWHSGN